MFYIGSKSGEPQVSAFELMRRECELLSAYCKFRIAQMRAAESARQDIERRIRNQRRPTDG